MSRFETAQISELEDSRGWASIRRRFDIGAFGINAWAAKEDGASIVVQHDEASSGHEELYLVLDGHATFTVDGEDVDAPAGTIVFVGDPEAKRGAVARVAGTRVLVVGAKPGEAYGPPAWETNASVLPLFDEGRYDEIKRVLTEGLERYESHPGLLYNLACAEAQLGETEAALEHLRASIEARPAFAEGAREDTDFDPVRDDPRFRELVG